MQTLEQQVVALEARILEYENGIKADQIVRSIAVNSPSNIMLLDLDARIQYINRTVPGITPDEMVGLRIPDIVEEKFRPGIIGALQRVAESGQPDRYETSYTSPSGDLSWWDSGVGPVLQDSKVTGFVVVSTNTTEQRRKHEEQERFFNLSVDMMCVAGADGFFRRVNQAFKTSLGYNDELLSRPFLDFVHPEDRQPTMESVARLYAGESVLDFCNRYQASDGTYRLLSWRGVADLKSGVVYAVARDITDARKNEDRLQQSRRMEAIGQLAGGIAHDFNNLLTVILGNIELAQAAPECATAALSNAMEAASRAANLTRQLLLFSRHQALSPTVIDLRPVVENLMGLLKRLLPENIRVSLQQEPDAPLILADQSQLEQVIINLCVNARDAMPEGGSLALTLSRMTSTGSGKEVASTPAGVYLVVTVADSGGGMSPEVQARMFEPFFTTKEVGKGTGLGLATVYGIVKEHQGFIDVLSAPGHGTTFRIVLPASEKQAPVAPLATTPLLQTSGGRETLLFAEDEPMVRTVVTQVLAQAGYTVLTAADGREAVELFKQHGEKISLALLDVVMPNMGGINAAEKLRKLQPELKIMFASGHVQNQSDLDRLESEVFLSKPFQREKLLATIRKLLDAQRNQADHRKSS